MMHTRIIRPAPHPENLPAGQADGHPARPRRLRPAATRCRKAGIPHRASADSARAAGCATPSRRCWRWPR